jgi:SAM-dependent methyltransferase
VTSKKLDVGCGKYKVPGSIGLDWIGSTDADVVCDLTKFPWPLEASSFDEVFAHNILEHLNETVATIEEIHRVAKSGAILHIRTPHFASLESWEDPTHVKHFAMESFDYFCEGSRHVGYYSKCRFRIKRKKLHFSGHPMALLGRFFYWLSPRKYERRWAFIFRPGGMDIDLEVIK